MTLKPTDIATLVEVFAASDWDELHVEIDGLHLFLSTDPGARLASGGCAAGSPENAPGSTQAKRERSVAEAAPQPAATLRAIAPSSPEAPANWIAVTAPNLGTFYRAPKPGAAPYIEEGQSVSADTEVCLLEVMKLFTAVKAGTAGIVRRICVSDAAMVEFGQTLMYIELA